MSISINNVETLNVDTFNAYNNTTIFEHLIM